MISDIFKVPIYQTNVTSDFKNLIDCLKKISEEESGVKKSNIGGWQSNNLVEKEELQNIISSLQMHFLAFSSLLNCQIDIKPSNIWANINRYKDYNRDHIHPGSKLSGVYYIKVPKDSGDIYFINPAAKYIALTMGAEYCSVFDTSYNFSEYITPNVGDLFLFPSWLEHGVLPNMNISEERISLSFNLN